MNKKSKTWLLIGLAIFLVLLIVAVVAFINKDKAPEAEKDNGEDIVEQTLLNTLPEDSWEIQDNVITDSWGVVLRTEELPKGLQNGESYTITIDGETYDLTENKFDDTVYNGQVPSIEHTEEEVAEGIIEKVE